MHVRDLGAQLVGVETCRDNGVFQQDVEADVEESSSVTGQVRIRAILRPKTATVLHGYRFIFRLHLPGEPDWRAHHHAMPRLHREMTLPLRQKLGASGLPKTAFTTPGNEALPCGRQDMALHPAFVIFQEMNPGCRGWLVGPLSRRRSRMAVDWSEVSEGEWDVAILFDFSGLVGFTVAAGEALELEALYVELFRTEVDFGPGLFEGYHVALQAEGLTGYVERPGAIARHEVMWGSWNEGVYRNVSHDYILKQARWMARHLPNVKWIQLDDGYHVWEEGGEDKNKYADAGAHWQQETAWCRRRFPQGMRAVADEIKSLGLHPMIWFTPSCTTDRPLFQQRPDLFIPGERLHFVPQMAFLDFSKIEVRDLICRILDRLFIEWGFEGVKLDFWTYGFERQLGRLSNASRTNLEWMHWLGMQIRQRIGPGGLMLSCLEPANGDPFQSEIWDTHRVGPDIDGVKDEALEEIAVAVAALVGLKQTQRRFWIPDFDGISLFRYGKASDQTWRLLTTMAVVTGTLMEIAGDLASIEKDNRLEPFLRLMREVRFGQTVLCPGYNWSRNGGLAPRVWVRRDEGGGRLVGVTNWGDEALNFAFDANQLDVKPDAVLIDLFSGEEQAIPLRGTMPPHDGRLWKIGSI